jgi:hypothetical protein
MTSAQYRTALAALGLSQARAADFLGVSLKQSQRWANRHAPVPEAVAKLLRLMVQLHLSVTEVR